MVVQNNKLGNYFITFEGGEGTGKSSQIVSLVQHLKQLGILVAQTREPGGVESAEVIRQLLVTKQSYQWDSLTEALLQCAARRENYLKCIKPALQRQEWVVCDRFLDSTFAYQGAGQGVSRSLLEQLTSVTLQQFKPDLTFVLDIEVNIGLERSYRRLQHTGSAENRFEEMDQSFHQRIRQAFQEIAHKNPDRCVLIDAGRSLQEVSDHIWAIVQQRFLSVGG